jgi:hypothetical protein
VPPGFNLTAIEMMLINQHKAPSVVLLNELTSPQFTAIFRSSRSFVVEVYRLATGMPVPRNLLIQLAALLDRHIDNRFQVAAHILSLPATYTAAIGDNARTFGLPLNSAQVNALLASIPGGLIGGPQDLSAAVATQFGGDTTFIMHMMGVCNKDAWTDLTVNS